jgi:hypothetical protein
VRGLPSPFIKIYKRGRETPHPSLLPLLLKRKDFLAGILGPMIGLRRDLDRQFDPLLLPHDVQLERLPGSIGI